jgi:hypothetical protein
MNKVAEVIDVLFELLGILTDIKGIPSYNFCSNTMTWAFLDRLPADSSLNCYSVCFWMNRTLAAPATQAAAFRLALNPCWYLCTCLEGVSIVAQVIPELTKVSYCMCPFGWIVFLHLELRTDYEDWLEWAVNNFEHEQVVGYLGFAKQDLLTTLIRRSLVCIRVYP